MTAGFSQEQIVHLAQLAKLDLSEAEIESYRQELTSNVADPKRINKSAPCYCLSQYICLKGWAIIAACQASFAV